MDISSSLAQLADWTQRACLMQPYIYLWEPTASEVWKLKGKADGLEGDSLHIAALKKHYPVVVNALKSNTPIEWNERKVKGEKVHTSIISYVPLFDERLKQGISLYLHQVPEWLEHFFTHPDIVFMSYEVHQVGNPFEKFARALNKDHRRDKYLEVDVREAETSAKANPSSVDSSTLGWGELGGSRA